ncbi:MAG: hypothetical protein ACXQTZ_04480 [Candidatus Alkanophagales archaeon]
MYVLIEFFKASSEISTPTSFSRSLLSLESSSLKKATAFSVREAQY